MSELSLPELDHSFTPKLTVDVARNQLGIYPERPEELSEAALKEWDKIYSYMSDSGILTPMDEGSLACYCHFLALFKAITVETNKILSEMTSEDFSNQDYQIRPVTTSPLFVLQRNCATMVKDFSSILGLNPASRKKLGIELGVPKNVSALESFLS